MRIAPADSLPLVIAVGFSQLFRTAADHDGQSGLVLEQTLVQQFRQHDGCRTRYPWPTACCEHSHHLVERLRNPD